VEVDKVVSAAAGALAVLVALSVLDGRRRHNRPGCIATLTAARAPYLHNEVAAETVRIVLHLVEIR
jgi:hypothetical protein